MNYLITAAGLGTRFLKEGIKPPKPLIKVNGLELILWSLMSFNFMENDILYIVTLESDNVKNIIIEKIKNLFGDIKVNWLELEEVKNGQLITAIEAIKFFKIEGKLLIHNCDTSYSLNNFNFEELDSCFGAIPYFQADGDNWSFIIIENGLITEVKEKKRISNNCSIGTYFFSETLEFLDIAKNYISHNNNIKEFYIAPIYEFAIKKSLKVIPLKCKSFKLFGTPSELLKTFKISFFELISENDFKGNQRKTIVCDVDGTICSNPEYGDYSKCLPINDVCNKLKLENDKGTYIILYTSRNLRSFKGNLGLINKYTSKTLIDWLTKNDIPYDELHLGKPWGEGNLFYLDDKLISINQFLNN